MIIALLNPKGGVGRTTLATHLAGELARSGRRVAVIDADPQGSALGWSRRRAQRGIARLFGVIGMARDTLHISARNIARDIDHVVIDGSSRITPLTRSALLAADLALIPVQPSPYDVWASTAMVSLVVEALAYRPALRARFVINRNVTGSAMERATCDALALHRFVPVLAARVTEHTVFAESAAEGLLAHEIDARSNASQALRTLTAEVLKDAS